MDEARRDALLRAMLLELGEAGYENLSVERALRKADVSLAEFAAEFADVDECLSTAYDRLSEQLVTRATASCDAEVSWPERVRAGLSRLLDFAADNPDLMKVLTRSFPAIRPATYQHYVDLLSAFTPYMEDGREYSEVGDELPGEVELLAVGAAEAIIFTEVDAGRATRLPAMMPEILFSVLVPFIGPDRAADEMRNAAAAR